MPLCETVRLSQPLKGVLLRRQTRSPERTVGAADAALEEAQARLAQLEAAHKKALEEAYRKGVGDGQAQARQQAEARLSTMEKNLGAAVAALVKERSTLAAELEGILPELIIEGVGRVLYGLEPDGETIQRIVRELLSGFDTEDSARRLFLNPEDLKSLQAVQAAFEESDPGLRLVADASLHRGECYLEGRFGLADARYSAKLSSLRKVLE